MGTPGSVFEKWDWNWFCMSPQVKIELGRRFTYQVKAWPVNVPLEIQKKKTSIEEYLDSMEEYEQKPLLPFKNTCLIRGWSLEKKRKERNPLERKG